MAFGEEGAEDRTEEATQHRREEWRKEGRVVQSRELVAALLVLSCTGALYGVSRWCLGGLWSVFETSFRELDRYAMSDWSPETIMSMLQFMLKALLYIVAPVGVAAFLTGILATLVQTGVVWSSKPLEFDPEKINPLNGFSKIFSLDGVIEMLKACLKFVVVGTVVYLFLRRRIGEAGKLWDIEPAGMSRYLATELVSGLVSIAMAMLIVAGADYLWQKFRYEQKIRMTKQEVREERKQLDGNPQIKARIRGIQRRISQSKMVEAVKAADVVITNPTHFAIALVYDRENMFAPKVVAKGADYMAQRIKQVARENGVPCVENVPLARALFKALKVGQFISRDFFNAVAEVLAYVYRLKGRTQL
jgi:flagellar biosynthetic protein FlhB